MGVLVSCLLASGCGAPLDDEETRRAEARLEDDAEVTPEMLLAKLETCRRASSSPYARDAGGTSAVHVCKLKNAVFFKADMDIDCDGKPSDVCNSSTDPWFQAQTAGVDSQGKPLDAGKLPFIVVPGVSSRWNYKNAGIAMGSVGVVIYDGKMEFGIVGDVGPKAIIGEASYAMAKVLGINPHPSTGGIGDGVSYILFTGPSARVTKNEDHAQAIEIGKRRAAQLLTEN
jgi:hypothetical protein